jgi:Holliday junction resolvase
MTPNKNYEKGRKAEYEAKKHLIMQGFVVTRAAGSKGPWDLIAVGPNHIKLVSVLREGSDRPSRRRKLRKVPAPPCVIKEMWVKIPYQGWEIEVLDGP